MDSAKTKHRSVIRRLFSKNCNEIEKIFEKKEGVLRSEIKSKIDLVEDLNRKLIALDKEIEEDILKTEFEEGQLESEIEDSSKYRKRWSVIKMIIEENSIDFTNDKMSTKRNFKLPTLELPKFDGNLKNWLPFWGQFKKIHEDISIDPTDKYQYLIQSIVPGTEVRAFIEGFPANEKSYAECIDELKSRYAKNNLLTQIYVRELIKIVANKDKSDSLVNLYDKINTQLRALATLGVVTDKHTDFLLPLIESALPTETLKIWERNKPTTNDELSELMRFLKREVESEQRIKIAETSFNFSECKDKANTEPTVGCFLMENKTEKKTSKKCLWCEKENHSSLECFKVGRMSLEERKAHLRKIKACPICLKLGHHPRFCKASVRCYTCGRRHSPVICSGSKEYIDKSTPASVSNQCAQVSNVTLLQTLTVNICHNGRNMEVRALIDSGAQRSYIKEAVAEHLNIPVNGTEVLTHSLFGGVQVGSKIYKVYQVSVKNVLNSFSFEMSALGQKCISNSMPKFDINDKYVSNLLLQNNVNLSDKGEGDIGLLIGADYSGVILTNIMVSLENGMLAINTKLGWVLQGRQKQVVSNNISTSLLSSSDVSGFWSLELLGIKDPTDLKSKAQIEVEAVLSFEQNIKVNESGRYETVLPWKPGYEELLSNRGLAERRLETTTKRLLATGKLSDYFKVFEDWLHDGIIEKVPVIEKESAIGCHYLPHRGVIKDSSLTTKLRPVFDASARDRNGKSLNASLNKGVNFLDKIPNLLIGFRKGKIGVTSDIAKAFLMISIAPMDRDYVRFLWWKDKSCSEIVEFRHCRVVFGLTSSPFLLSATINHHLNKMIECSELKGTSQILRKSFYVDNCLISLDSELELQKFISEAKYVMNQGKFDLRQWVSSPPLVNEVGSSMVSVLGLKWFTETDEFGCNVDNLPSLDKVGIVTKRNLMSITQSIFDPVGFTCPATLIPRLMIQDCWRRNLSWDQELPCDMSKNFRKWYAQINYLKNCRVPRRLTHESFEECNLSLHMFCDASKDAYSACILLRAETQCNISVQLVSAKARVAPPNRLTIPRLELTAALIGSRLLKDVRNNLGLQCKEFCWTDSCVTLCWVKKELPWNTYIGNRVKEIRENTNIDDWHHVPGSLNCADLASRGCTPEQLYLSRWWEGPVWLRRNTFEWPKFDGPLEEEEAKIELRKAACNVNVCVTESITDTLNNISRYSKIIKVVVMLKRFKHNTLHKYNRKIGEVTYEEFEEAEIKLLQLIQIENKDYIAQRTNNMNTYLDHNGVMRIKTKLLLSDFPESIRTPYLLPACSVIVRRIVEQRHLELQHVGVNQLITDLRKKYWIMGVRRLVKTITSHCAICARYRAKALQTAPAPLPAERLACSKAFEVTGIDLAGPLLLKGGQKCWIVLYTCAVYRAVHLELTLSLSTESFLFTLRRFIARRGRVKQIITDNGTNFTGTHHLLASIDWNEVQRSSTIERIIWKFNAPTAAWWGGFWERLIRILKDLLRRVLGKSQVKYDEMNTILCECEAVINERPLTYVQDDKNWSLEPITPAMFIQPIRETDVTDLDMVTIQARYKYLLKLREDFKQRFRNEYLTNLIETKKDKFNRLKIGDVVLVESGEKRVKWPLGLVTNIFEGQDGHGKTAEIKTSTGIKVRPFQRLYPLEISSSDVEGLKVLNESRLSSDDPSSSSQSRDLEASVRPAVTRSGRAVRMPSRYGV